MEHFDGGKITYYINGPREFIEVRCNNPLHVGCVLTRTMKANRANTGAQGRPLGLAVAWLKKGSGLPNKDAHKRVEITFAERREGRALLKERNSYNTNGLLGAERTQREGEDSEPEVRP